MNLKNIFKAKIPPMIYLYFKFNTKIGFKFVFKFGFGVILPDKYGYWILITVMEKTARRP